jgi:hypothetical protein
MPEEDSVRCASRGEVIVDQSGRCRSSKFWTDRADADPRSSPGWVDTRPFRVQRVHAKAHDLIMSRHLDRFVQDAVTSRRMNPTAVLPLLLPLLSFCFLSCCRCRCCCCCCCCCCSSCLLPLFLLLLLLLVVVVVVVLTLGGRRRLLRVGHAAEID